MLSQISLLPSFVIASMVLFAVLLLDLVLQVPQKYHPVQLFRLIAERLGSKVNPDSNREKLQLRISGTLALLAAILPGILILILFIPLSEYPIFFEALLLWFSLGLMPCLKDIKKVQRALAKQQKLLARDRLADWVLRQTRSLSPVGIAKAASEALVLRNAYFYQSIIFWFLVAGPYAALSVRLLLELNQVWNPKQSQYRYFGQPSNLALHLLIWLPSKLSALSYLVAGGIGQAIGSIKKCTASWPYSNSLWPLAFAAAASQSRLGGPVLYDQLKIRRPQLNLYPQPNELTIKKLLQLVLISNLVWLLCLIVIDLVILYGQ